MHKPFSVIVAVFILSIVIMAYTPQPYERAEFKVLPDFDPILIVAN